MFNNPFNSFHDTVAEAKEEREQLDRLLTVSTPRERLLVTVTAIVLASFIGWLFFGSADRSLTVDGVLVEAGNYQSESGQSVRGLVWIENGDSPQIETGMPAVIDFGSANEAEGAIGGVISAVSAVSLSELPAAFEPAAPVSAHLVDITLDESRDLASMVGRETRIVIELGTQAPVAFLRLR